MNAADPLAEARVLLDRAQYDAAVAVALEQLEAHPHDDVHVRRVIDLVERCAARASEAQARASRGRRAARAIRRRLAEACERLELTAEALVALEALEPEGADDAHADELVSTIERLRARARRLVLRDAIAAVVGALLVLAATPPLGLWPLGLVGVAVALLALREATTTRALVAGWICGFVVNAVGFAWGSDLLRRFVHVGPLAGLGAVVALAAYQAGVFAAWLGGATWLRRRFGVPAIIAAPLAVAVAEAAIPFLFPWYLALVFAPAWPLAQIAELGGPPAVSALVVFGAAVLAEALASFATRDRASSALAARVAATFELRRPGSPRAARVGAYVGLAIVAVGLARAAQVSRARDLARHLRVGVVQPNLGIVPPKERAQRADAELVRLRGATADAARAGAELVVWPESAFPYLFDRDLPREYPEGHPWALRPGFSGRLLFGTLSHEFGTDHVFNSVVLVGKDGRVAGLADKRRLLAFGEYVPFAERYPAWASRVRARMDDFPEIVPGAAPKLLVDGELRIAPLVCYEDLLPDHAQQVAELGANLLVTAANHAWFAGSVAPKQAEMLAVFRGIETRRDLVRATTTGVSSVSDALGRVLSSSDGAAHHDAAATTLVADVALLDVRPLGSRATRAFPIACGLGLALAAALSARARRSSAAGPGRG